MLRFALTIVRVWTTLYTSGMPDGLRETRRAEIESDLWESQHDRRPESNLGVGVQILLRLLRGIPDDLLWRVELMDLRRRRRRIGMWITATAGVVLWAALWVGSALTPSTLPQPPHPMVFVAGPPPAPPPPPPPPPPPLPSVTVEFSSIPPPPSRPIR
jgi:hypothetical protein